MRFLCHFECSKAESALGVPWAEKSIKIGFLHCATVLSCESKNGGFGRNDKDAHNNHSWCNKLIRKARTRFTY
jgi:hypothetical protein